MTSHSWEADEGDGGSNKTITLSNNYRRYWSTNPSGTNEYLAVTIVAGSGDSSFSVSGNTGTISANGSKTVTVGWGTSLGIGSYSLTNSELWSNVGSASRSGGPASLTINEAPAEATHDITGTLSMSWSHPSNVSGS